MFLRHRHAFGSSLVAIFFALTLGTLHAAVELASSSSGTPLDRLPTAGHRWVVLDGPASLDSREEQEALDAFLDRAADAGDHVSLALHGMPTDPQPEALDPWLAFVRQAVRLSAGRIVAVQLGDRLDAYPQESYAYLLKASSLAARAEARGAGASIELLQAAVDIGDLARQQALWPLDVAPYIDGIVLSNATTADPSAILARWAVETLQYPPAPRLWFLAQHDDLIDRSGAALSALAAGAAVAVIEAKPGDGQDVAQWSAAVQRLLAEGYAPAPLSGIEVRPEGRALARFFNDADGRSLVFFYADAQLDDTTARLRVPDPAIRETTRMQFLGGEDERVGSSADGGGRAIRVQGSVMPQAVRFVRPSGPLDLPVEEIRTEGQREPTAEEILARHRQIQREQDDRLERWTARGRTDFHFSLTAGGGTIDYSIESNYFWERGRELEWEETEYYINGNKLNWKKIPDIPLIQPEKVISLPLDLSLDRTYVYTKIGREKVGDREAWVLAYEPSDPNAPLSLYRGKVWIDTETFERLRSSLVQTRLEPPVLSNEEIDDYALVMGDDGHRYRMLGEVDGQQLWNAGGRNFVVQREVYLWDIRINPEEEDFNAARERAYAGNNKIIRDTAEGFRYLKKNENGEREVQTELDTSQIFAGGGGFKDRSTDGIVPLAGVNYFNYDLFGKGVQMNAFFAGPLGFFTFSDPNAFGKNWDTTINASLSAIKPDDELFFGDLELVSERVQRRTQNVSFNLGIPLGKFSKLNLGSGVRYIEFFADDDAKRILDDFNTSSGRSLALITPPDHAEYRTTASWELNRRGWSFGSDVELARRSRFARFGVFETGGPNSFVRFDPLSGDYLPTTVADAETEFSRYSLLARKEWYLPSFQKFRISAHQFGGSDLDRFSRWQFSLFGDTRLSGYSGSGVRFDDGTIVRTGYSFNLFEAIRFDAGIESGWVEDESSGVGRQNHGGFGIGANFVAPWKLVVSFNYGRALWSDIPELEGEEEFLLLVLRLF